MKSTTGAEATALSIAALVSADRNLAHMGNARGAILEAKCGTGRAASLKACEDELGKVMKGNGQAYR